MGYTYLSPKDHTILIISTSLDATIFIPFIMYPFCVYGMLIVELCESKVVNCVEDEAMGIKSCKFCIKFGIEVVRGYVGQD